MHLQAYTSQKLPYLVMEFVPCTLKRFLSESGPGLEVDVRKSVVYQVSARCRNPEEGSNFQIGQGLLYVHERGMMHRDLKPDNILVVEEPLTVKIADFGHAREGVNAKGGLTNAVSIPQRGSPASVYLIPPSYGGPTSHVLWEVGPCLFEVRPLSLLEKVGPLSAEVDPLSAEVGSLVGEVGLEVTWEVVSLFLCGAPLCKAPIMLRSRV